jgi:NAD(P)-dependent dehydrogenase (short-subunit alcohol dehydrogenase family)
MIRLPTAAIDDVAKRKVRLDILHSRAGLQIEGKLENVSVNDMDASWALNVRAHGGGRIIITSSNSGVHYDREMIAYATTKHAVLVMTRQMAADYAKKNISFNSLYPGFTGTPFNRGFEI